MNWKEFEGKWDQVKGQVREKWGKLTNDDLTMIKGKRDQLLGKLKERYGYAADRAEREIDEFMSDCGCDSSRSSNTGSSSASRHA